MNKALRVAFSSGSSRLECADDIPQDGNACLNIYDAPSRFNYSKVSNAPCQTPSNRGYSVIHALGD